MRLIDVGVETVGRFTCRREVGDGRRRPFELDNATRSESESSCKMLPRLLSLRWLGSFPDIARFHSPIVLHVTRGDDSILLLPIAAHRKQSRPQELQ